MLLLEIFDLKRGYKGGETAGQAVAGEQRWHYDRIGAPGAEKPNPMQLQKAGLVQNGVWWLSPLGKKLAGPFPDMVSAERFRTNRPDRVPDDAVAKRIN